MKPFKEDTRKRHIENPVVNKDIKTSSIERIKEAEAEIKRLENI